MYNYTWTDDFVLSNFQLQVPEQMHLMKFWKLHHLL